LRTLTGTAPLVRFILRLDRVRLAIWISGLVVLTLSSAASLPGLYPTQADIDEYATLFGDNPALVAFAGPGYGFDDPNIGVILVNEVQLFSMIAMALMAIFLLNRHTRAEEDAERADLVRSGTVGRDAPIAAAVIAVSATVLVISALCTVGFVALEYPTTGSVALGGSLAAVGLVFVGVATVTAQLASSSRSALGLASTVLGVSFVLRAAGDIGDNALRWLSPIGWAQGVRAYADERWWLLGLCVVVAVMLVFAGFWLSAHRDLGSGILPTRLGPPDARGVLTRPGGLALRLQRGALIGWVVGLLLTGVVYGSLGDDVATMIEDNPAFEEFLAQVPDADLTASFFATSVQMLGLLAAGFAVSSALRLRTEESQGRAEPLLATPTPRTRWAASHLVISVLGSVLVVGAGGFGLGAAYAVVIGDGSQVMRMLGASLAAVPAVLVLAGLAVALFGLVPRYAQAAWAGLAISAVVTFFGQVLQLPDWTMGISPFHHIPPVPAESLTLAPVVALLSVAAALGAIGLVAFRRRDLAAQ
jgi:ABC-2 type transport system permease protein